MDTSHHEPLAGARRGPCNTRGAFGAARAWSDLELAELFTVPLDQVARRRRDYVAAD